MTDKYANLRASLAALKLGGPVSTDPGKWNAATDALDVELVAELLAERDAMVQAQPAAVSDEQILKTLRPDVWMHVEGRHREQMLADARAILALRPQADPIGLDVEAMIKAVLPGGYSCDPQQVADAIRAYMALRPQAVPMTELPDFDELSDDAIDNACATGGIYRADFMRAWESLRADGITAQAKEGGA